MKAIRIFLLILIIIGIIALITENFWVPKLVNKIISSETPPVIIEAVAHQANLVLKDGRQCYTYNHEGTKDEPYTVNEFIDITISGAKVTGTKTGTQSGPDMTNGYSGKITGTLENNAITDIFSYVVEGSHNQEEEIYKASLTGIEKLRYPLIEVRGILVPDKTKPFTAMLYARVGCTASN
jgi:hypothetical protein